MLFFAENSRNKSLFRARKRDLKITWEIWLRRESLHIESNVSILFLLRYRCDLDGGFLTRHSFNAHTEVFDSILHQLDLFLSPLINRTIVFVLLRKIISKIPLLTPLRYETRIIHPVDYWIIINITHKTASGETISVQFPKQIYPEMQPSIISFN